METKADTFWLDFKSCFLKKNAGNKICQSWLESITPPKLEKRSSGFYVTLQAPSDLHKKWLQDNLLEAFSAHLHQFYQGSYNIQLEVSPCLPVQKKQGLNQDFFPQQSLFFNPDYTFENFIVGKNNDLVYEACLSITKTSKKDERFNPLFIYGPSGLGKTHLLNAIGQKILQNQPQTKIVYLSAERFLNEFISAIQDKKMEAFRKKFRRNCDLLLMDDIQIISNKTAFQEEFFHTFNDLYNKKAQIVICCDQTPSDLPHLEERIRSRLEGGLMADISYPDEETRMAILKNKIEKKDLFLSEQGLSQIAKACKKSVRDMEGVLNKIKMLTELHEGKLPLKEIEKILKNLHKELTIESIQTQTVKAFRISLEELTSPSRKKHIVIARQTAMYLIRTHLKKSLKDISLAFGKKDHTTVLNSIKKVEKLRLKDREFQRVLNVLHKEIHNY